RHTRSKRDWSSDVCSSDLAISGIAGGAGSVGGIFFPIFAGWLLDKYQKTAGGESAGYAILFAICASAYVVAFIINHLLAPRFVQIGRASCRESVQLPVGAL